MFLKSKIALTSLVAVTLLSACGGGKNSDKNNGSDSPSPVVEKQNKALDMTIIHINDHHSHLGELSMKLKLGDKKTYTKVGGFSRVVSSIKKLRSSEKNPVTIHAGDAVTGDLYYTLFKGEADAAMMNQVCFDYFTLGNHEFDDGDAGLKKFLDFLAQGNCDKKTEVISANVIPEVGVSPLAKNTATDYFKPYSIREIDGAKVGFIGLDIANKTKQSSSPDATTQFLDEAETAQKYIDILKKKHNVNKVVLITHYQYENDKILATKLDGVDVIIGGDSHSLLGDFKKYGLNPVGDYPTKVKDKSGNLVCVAQAWEYSAVVGKLNISFDKNGVVKNCEGTPYLLIGESFRRKNSKGKKVELEGNELAAVKADIDADKQLQIMAEDSSAKAKLAEFSGKVEGLKKEKIGEASENLCLERVPGQGKSALCDKSVTQDKGSDITNLVAQAFLEMAIKSEVCIQNGGGVRVDVPKGDITIGTAYTLLPFANTIYELDMTGAEIKSTLEDAVDFAKNGSTGAYPYAAGLRWNVDMTKAKGERVSNLQVKVKGETTWKAIDNSKLYKVATNSYIASGKDGYTTMGTIPKDRRLDTYLDYAQSFVDYVKKKGSVSKPADEDYSTQSFISAPK